MAYAKAQLAESAATFKDFDDKAGALAQVAGGAAGLFGAGAVASLSSGAVNSFVVAACVPPLLASALAAGCSLAARWPRDYAGPPGFGELAAAVAHYAEPPGGGGSQAEVRAACHVYLASAHLAEVNGRKGWWVRAAYASFAVAVACLALPLVAVIVSRQ